MTMQIMFNKVWDHFIIKENDRCEGKDLNARYKFHGKSCAIGLFIPKNIYRRTMEGKEIESLLDYSPELKQKFEDIPIDFLFRLQYWHDMRLCSVEEGKDIAKKFRLKVPTGK